MLQDPSVYSWGISDFRSVRRSNKLSEKINFDAIDNSQWVGFAFNTHSRAILPAA
jgi:aldehyde:ferredoxin oxidoreductase